MKYGSMINVNVASNVEQCEQVDYIMMGTRS